MDNMKNINSPDLASWFLVRVTLSTVVLMNPDSLGQTESSMMVLTPYKWMLNPCLDEKGLECFNTDQIWGITLK